MTDSLKGDPIGDRPLNLKPLTRITAKAASQDLMQHMDDGSQRANCSFRLSLSLNSNPRRGSRSSIPGRVVAGPGGTTV